MTSDESAAGKTPSGAAATALDSVELSTGDAPRHSIIWLHGLGADGHDFEPIVPHLGLGVPVRFVFPHAPVRPVTLNGGMPMRAWYDIRSLEASREVDATGIEASCGAVTQLVQREIDRGIASERIVLAGFSQGGAIATLVSLRFPRRLAGLVALSTYALFADRMVSERHDANAALPAFVAHGRQDPMVPFAAGQQLAERLRAAGHPTTWRAYPMPHAVCDEEIRELGEWLRNLVQ